MKEVYTKNLKNTSQTIEVKSDYFFYHNVLYNFIPFNTKKINLVWYIINDVILWHKAKIKIKTFEANLRSKWI